MRYKRIIIAAIAAVLAGTAGYLYLDPIGSRLTVATEPEWNRYGMFEGMQVSNGPAFLLYVGETDESARKSRIRLIERCCDFSQRSDSSGYCENATVRNNVNEDE